LIGESHSINESLCQMVADSKLLMSRNPSSRFFCTAAAVGLLTLMAFEMAWIAYEFLVVNEGIQYFASRPRQLLLVLGIALAGTGLVVAFSRLSSSLRRGLALVLLGSVATGTTAFLGLFINDLITLPPPLLETGLREGLLLVVPAFLLAASLFWFEFVRLLRQKREANSESMRET
jgi:hypothetical protein